MEVVPFKYSFAVNNFLFILNDDNILLEPNKAIKIFEQYENKCYIIGTKLIMEQKQQEN